MRKFVIAFIKRQPLEILVPVLLLALLAVIVFGLQLGYLSFSLPTIVNVLLYKIFGWSPQPLDNATLDVVWQLRLPRVLLAACVGMGLTLSGLIMQAVVQNPLADPYILGMSSGASLGATSAIFLGAGSIFGAQAVGICACAGAFGVSLLVVFICSRGEKNNAVRLLLSGMALSAVCSSASGFIVYIGKNKEGMEAITYWLMGTVANAKLPQVLLLLFLTAAITLYFTRRTRILNLFLLGSDTAMTLGVDLRCYLPRFLLLNGLLTGFIVLNAGMIGFIGLVVPHMVRSVFGSNHKKLLPAAVLSGGIFAAAMDIMSRTLLHGVDIPLGVVFALIGAPCFIYLMLQKKYKFGGN